MKNDQSNIYTNIEILSTKLKNLPSEDEDQFYDEYAEEISGCKIVERISKFDSNEFHYRWSFLIILLIFYNIFSAGYFFGTITYPTGIWIGIELISEGIIVADFIIRIRITKYSDIEKMWFLKEDFTTIKLILLVLSSFPYSIMFELFGKMQSTTLIALRFLKLLRIYQIKEFFEKKDLIIKSKFSKLTIYKIILGILVLTHFSAMLWLFDCKSYEDGCSIGDKSDFDAYIVAIFWASETLTGVVLTKLSTNAVNQKIIIFSTIFASIILYCSIFCILMTYLQNINLKRIERSTHKGIIQNWCEKRKINQALRQRIYSYYILANEKFIESIKIDLPTELPLSIKSEISLHLHKDLISKVKLFEMGEPSFMMSMVRAFTSEVFLPGDCIIRIDDFANSMYFISKGLVEILATDGISQIALLDDGCYFGEIGILLNCCRTVSVKAVVSSILAQISKEELISILANFPEHYDFLMNVAKQRLKTCTKEDIDLLYDLVEDNYSSSDSDRSGELETPQYYAPAEHDYKSFILRLFTVPHSKSRKGSIRIDPLSWFFYLWTILLCSAYTACLFIIPYSIAFSPNYVLLGIDLGSYLIFLLDIIVKYNSSIITEYRSYIQDKETIQKTIFNDYFTLDILSIIPSDWVYCAFECNSSSMYYLKLLRLLKLYRVISLLTIIKNSEQTSAHILRLASFMYIFLASGHIIACFLTAISTSSKLDNYIENLYWSFSILSITTYGDINTIDTYGQLFILLLMNLSKLCVVYLYAECSNLIEEINKPYTDFISKINYTEEWMAHVKLKFELKEKVRSFYKFLWEKLRGFNEEEILNNLPESLSIDLRYEVFSGLSNSEIFPKDERGAMLGIIRKCRLSMFSKGMHIINQGELGLEMFFIIEGLVDIINSDGVLIKELHEGDFFGEFSMLDETPTTRSASAIAKSNLTLAVLSAEDFRLVSSIYPGFESKVRSLATLRAHGRRFDENTKGEINFNDGQKLSSKDILEEKSLENIEGEFSGMVSDNNYELENKNLTTIMETKAFDQQIIVKFNPLTLRIYHYHSKVWLYFCIWLWNIIFMPLQLAFNINFRNGYLLLEIITIIFYSVMSIYYSSLYAWTKSNFTKFIKTKNPKIYLFYSIYHLIIAFPFAMIASLTSENPSKLVLAICCYIRISNAYFIFLLFRNLKQRKIYWYMVIQCIEILVIVFCFAHIIACNFILVGTSWISEIQNPSNTDIYVNAFYWSVSTIAHDSLGDIKAISDQEKLYTCFIQFLSCFFYALIFGTIISLIGTHKFTLRNKLYNDYSHVIMFLKKKGIDNKFQKVIDDYFNDLWSKNKGITESEVLACIPSSLKVEIFLSRYGCILEKTDIFTNELGLNISLIRSIYSMMRIQFNLLGDIILRIDDLSYDMYIIIDGEATIIALEGNSILDILGPGSHFGETNMLLDINIRTATVVATKISQLGVISKNNMQLLLQCYPEWKEKLMQSTKDRMLRTFKTNDMEEVNKVCGKIYELLTNSPETNKAYTKQSEQLIAHRVAEILSDEVIDKLLTLNVLHLILIIYSCIAIPLEIISSNYNNNLLVAMEGLCICESVI